MGYVTVSARIGREVYEKLKMYGIVIGVVIRRALEEVRRREEEELHRVLRRVQEILARIPLGSLLRLSEAVVRRDEEAIRCVGVAKYNQDAWRKSPSIY
ncbi:MAG: CopG family transcriptional regulator [Sulfolobales archaeon]